MTDGAPADALSEVHDRLQSHEALKVWASAPLAPFTSIGVGGPAGLLISVLAERGLAKVLEELHGSAVPWLVLGSGTNVLVADQGYSGVVVRLDESYHYAEGPMSNGELVVGAAVGLPRVAALAAEAGLSGLEFACGIPGSLGGAVAMNAGAHGGAMADVVTAVELTGGEGSSWVSAPELTWEYRRCALPPGCAVTAVRFRLELSDPQTVAGRHRTLLRVRRQTQPRGVRTFGSTFKNPPEGSAGRLLEAAGMKGIRRGGARVSTVHANFIGNVGDATANDVLGLMTMMREAVYVRDGILLEPEVRLLGTVFPWEGAGGSG